MVWLCVLWWGALDRLWLRAAQFLRVCSTTGYITSGLRGLSPQALTLFGGVGFITWDASKRGMPTGSEAFLELPVALGFGPATGSTLKTALCHIRTLVGCRINIGMFFAENIPEPVLDYGPECGSEKGTMADLGHQVSTRLRSGGRAALLSPL